MVRCLLLVALLTAQVAACAGQPTNRAAIDAMERHHQEQMIRMGSSGGGSM